MLAFHNDPAIKAFYLARVRRHRAADQIVKGVYWREGRGCAVGCTIHGSDHTAYERDLGIPRIFAALELDIFECLPCADAMVWPERFLEAVPVGADLSDTWRQFAIELLAGPNGAITFARTAEQRRIIQDAIACHERGAAFVPPAEWATPGIYRGTALTADKAATYAAIVSDDSNAAHYAAVAVAAAAGPERYAVAWQQAHARQADTLVALLEAAPVPVVLELRPREIIRV